MNAVASLQADAEQSAVVADQRWYKDAIIYQVHVKSFFDSNDDGIGDFPGLISKLDYIAELGVDTIWLLPFYPSPRRDDGYDIAEYMAVHPDYGSIEDFEHLVAHAHARGIRIVTELVINHTSDQHPWFQRARNAPAGSPERDFYVWSDTDQEYEGTRIIFCDTEKSNWTWDPVAGQYFWHRFYSHQPDLNFDNPAVLDAVLEVMRFWLDRGVDGLRLDAVPYLIERAGTSNENLPETHAILRKIRATLDAEYPDRMLLAEANMWPEDTQQYFGQNADECHMAFHFPLMPRMYMAIAREDRFPITDIMRQTPEIPESCQWAIFLRNHDELTLEMVTDSERDYLWQTYAADRRARINLGIRRRLAPLLERDRRRIELMTSLLLTMPGTPVLYYGDEIGMGDNIHLGDRDGVRTPMQWSIDRNGGFSRADPAQLVLPPVMDPLYGFQAVNVEAQIRDQHSLLTWTRRVLSVRKRYQAFGRGSLRFLYPGNRRMLAYLRCYQDETVLCVANLSHTLQAVELDLSEFEGRVPVDIIGGGSFPPIGRLTYLLTVPPFGFYAFQLVSEGTLPDWHVPSPVPLPDYRTLVLRSDADESAALLPHLPTLEGEILPAWLSARRWFSAKDQVLRSVRIARRTPLPGDEPMTLLELEVALEDGRHERYMLPVGIVWEREQPSTLAEQLALARVRQGREVGYLTDAFALKPMVRGVIDALRSHAALDFCDGDDAAQQGQVCFEATPALATLDIPQDPEIRWLSAEQSNSSLVVADKAVFKLLRHVAVGANPEIEIGRRLTEMGYAAAGQRQPDRRAGHRHHHRVVAGLHPQPGRCLALDAGPSGAQLRRIRHCADRRSARRSGRRLRCLRRRGGQTAGRIARSAVARHRRCRLRAATHRPAHRQRRGGRRGTPGRRDVGDRQRTPGRQRRQCRTRGAGGGAGAAPAAGCLARQGAERAGRLLAHARARRFSPGPDPGGLRRCGADRLRRRAGQAAGRTPRQGQPAARCCRLPALARLRQRSVGTWRGRHRRPRRCWCGYASGPIPGAIPPPLHTSLPRRLPCRARRQRPSVDCAGGVQCSHLVVPGGEGLLRSAL